LRNNGSGRKRGTGGRGFSPSREVNTCGAKTIDSRKQEKRIKQGQQ